MKWKFIGPGLLYAGAAVGVSHLVQSTRAGAMYGFELVGAVIFINILKYPFFEIGTRYTIATGNNLLNGYKNLGSWAVWSFLAISTGTMCIIVAVVTLVTAGLFQNLTGVEAPMWIWSAGILLVCTVLLGFGKYQSLDKIIRVVVLLLTVSTLVSLGMAIYGAPKPTIRVSGFDFQKSQDLLFLVALLGWMPIPIEAAVWQSDWTLAAKKEGESLPKFLYAKLDFQIGYWGTTLLALAFLSLGALMMYGTGVTFSENAVAFSDQLVNMISKNLGTWAYPFIALAACLTMFSTTITCLDAYPRVVSSTLKILFPEIRLTSIRLYWIFLVSVALGAIWILGSFRESMKNMVDFATTVSFLTAPGLAYIHYLISESKEVQSVLPTSRFHKNLSKFGILFLTLFAIYYLYIRFIN